MDTALLLKKQIDSGKQLSESEILRSLSQSKLVAELLHDSKLETLDLMNRLCQLSEIPHAHKLPKVKEWVNQLASRSHCGNGFSFSGKTDDLLSCYNSMIVSVLIKMDYPDKTKIESGINWILNYQLFERGIDNRWPGKRILKYGGCLKSTPCYIGIVKATIALSDFKHQPFSDYNEAIEEKLAKGLGYILNHELFKRHSNQQAITKDILKIAYPFSYKTNIIELLRLMKANKLHMDNRCLAARNLLVEKKKKSGYWQQNRIYTPKCWIPFEPIKEPGLWVSHEIEKILS